MKEAYICLIAGVILMFVNIWTIYLSIKFNDDEDMCYVIAILMVCSVCLSALSIYIGWPAVDAILSMLH